MLEARCKCHVYGWGLCPHPQDLKDRLLCTLGCERDKMALTKRKNGVTGDERTWVTDPGIVSQNLEHHSVLRLAFPQGVVFVLPGREGEYPYPRIFFCLRFHNQGQQSAYDPPVPPQRCHHTHNIMLGTLTASLFNTPQTHTTDSYHLTPAHFSSLIWPTP